MSDVVIFFFFNDTATTEIYTLSLHDALPIWLLILTAFMFIGLLGVVGGAVGWNMWRDAGTGDAPGEARGVPQEEHKGAEDRKSTRLNSSHANISYAVFCLKKKKKSNCQSLRV